MYKAVKRCPSHYPVIAGAPNIDKEFYAKTLADNGIADRPLLIYGNTFELLANADAALVTSGTATLEAAIIGTPQVVCYRANGSKLSYKLFEHILKVPFVSLPNLIADKKVVTELLVHLCTEDSIYRELQPLLSDTAERRTMKEGYELIHQRLGTNDSAETTAACLIADLQQLKRN